MKLLYFSSPTCSVCKVLYPKVEQLIREKYPQFSLTKVDITVSPLIAAQFSVFSAPVLIVTINDKEQIRFARQFSIQQLDNQLKRICSLLS